MLIPIISIIVTPNITVPNFILTKKKKNKQRLNYLIFVIRKQKITNLT